MNLDKLYDKGLDWIILFGPKIILGVIVFIAGQWLIKFTKKRFQHQAQKRKVSPTLRPFFQSLIFTVLQVLLILLVMQIVGIELTMFAALVAAFGAAVGLALSGTLQNFASGILILLLKPFTVGDNIKAQGEEGTITSIQLFYTVMTTFDNRSVILPNSKLSNEVIVNITKEGSRRLDITLKLKYDVDIEHVKAIIAKAINDSKEMLNDPKYRIGIASLDEGGYKLIINVWAKAHGFEDAKLTIHQQILAALKAAGIQL